MLTRVFPSRIYAVSQGFKTKSTTQMAQLMKAKLFSISKMDTGNSPLRIKESTKECGRWTACMDRVLCSSRMEISRIKVIGTWINSITWAICTTAGHSIQSRNLILKISRRYKTIG